MSANTMAVNRITASSAPPPPKTSLTSQPTPTSLPLRSIPGSYGLPLLGPLVDRLNYSWFQGPQTFFKKQIEKNQSTVFRTNVPPSFPFFLVNPNVVAVLDCKSFAHMFDMEIIEKKNILVGDFMPSTKFTGDRRVCAYLDPSEPKHQQLKNFTMDMLKRSSTVWIPTLTSLLDTMWDNIESQLASGPVSYVVPIQKFHFAFLSRCIAGADPQNSPDMAENGYLYMDRWLALQILPTVPINAFQPLVEIFLHSFPYPYFLVSRDYNKLYEFIQKEGKEVIERGQTEFNLSREDAIHNLLFTLGFNAFGGFLIFFLSLLSTLESDKTGVQEKLRNEVREKAGSSGLSFGTVKEMELVQSFVYETLRLNPPVPLQYGRARKDFELSSHDSVFEVKKGELLCGFQPLVMKDPNVFDDPETFVADRFTKEKGKELLNYLYWSNGPQTGETSASNKQCAAKDFVPLTAALFLAHLFLRYDSVTIAGTSFSAVEKAKN
ncbi:fatty acid hydroperoxide lyase, chloroplastic-like [Cynara cardunculus var. scolymus]|uniref:fatty acid hydroperoxide lyase, chloroplastic-like n=1 Tax=Cynara cardunculus var. scolymus TaxID=59895 RepID=UPI000D62AE84|nr:fatty acid hydroperoxide lyase, chloroplastic-like [Cynara cardunculus var. scolymus]